MDRFEQYTSAARNLEITPPQGSWDRLEARLDAQKGRRRLLISRIARIAAAVTILVALSTIAVMMRQHNQAASEVAFQANQIEEMNPYAIEEVGIYDVEKVKLLSMHFKALQ